jgi:rhamnogalacturonan acetylesterase
MKFKHMIIGGLAVAAGLFGGFKKERPILYLIGDSTVATAPPDSFIQGWGTHLASFFDTTKIRLQNRAVPGTSSRTYQTKGVVSTDQLKNGLWDSVMVTLKPGDFVIMQFGHNDDSPIDDTARSRGSLKGIGTDSAVIFNRFLKKQETVHTYGWYLRKFISDTRSRGAVPVICSPIPKDLWKGSLVVRNTDDYDKWCAEVAANTGTLFINLNKMVADKYDLDGQARVDALYFVKDHIHTTLAGAQINAGLVASGIRESDSQLKKYLKKQ